MIKARNPAQAQHKSGEGALYQLPVFSILAHGSCGSRLPS